MPITTSVITGTVAHKHSATGGSSDGGKLATGGLGGDTSFDLASGSIMYSNGTSLDELVIGASGTVLTEAGGVPTWSAAGGSTWEIADDQVLTTPGTLQASISHYDQLAVYIRAANVGAQPTGITFNSTYTGTQYSSRYLTDFTTDEDNASVSNIYINGTNNTSSWWNIWMNIWNLDGQEKTCTWNAMLDKGTGNQSLGASFGCAKTTFTTDITSIEKVNLSTGQVVNQQTGSRMVVLGAL
jgi:hypothetical protein